jgi:hypothetical protein
MSIAKVIEFKSSSTKSFDDAIKTGMAKARESIRNIQSVWIKDQEITINPDGSFNEYRVTLKLTFVVD